MDSENVNEKEDSLDFNSNSSSFKEIVLSHIRRITILSSCELRGGYYTTSKSKGGEEKLIYIEDSREKLENAMYCLAQLLIKKFDKIMMKELDSFKDKLKTIKNKFLKDSTLDETEVLGEAFYTKEKDKVLLEEYKIKKLNNYKELFTEICKFLTRPPQNWFELGGGVF